MQRLPAPNRTQIDPPKMISDMSLAKRAIRNQPTFAMSFLPASLMYQPFLYPPALARKVSWSITERERNEGTGIMTDDVPAC